MLFSEFRKTCYSKCCKISYNIWSIINFDIRVTFDSIDLLILTQASKRTFIFLSPIFNLNNIVHYSNRFAKKISSKSEGENQKLERKRNHRFKKPFFPPSNVINNPTILIFSSSSSLSPSSVSPRLIHRGRARYLPLGSQKPRSTTKEGRGGEKKRGRVTSERDETGRALGRWEERLRVLRLYRYWSGRSRNRLLVRILVRFLSPARNSTKDSRLGGRTCPHNLPTDLDSNNLLWPMKSTECRLIFRFTIFVSVYKCIIYEW